MSEQVSEKLSELLDVAVSQSIFVIETVKAGDKELTSNRHLRWPNITENQIEVEAPLLQTAYEDHKNNDCDLKIKIKIKHDDQYLNHTLDDLVTEITRFNVVHDNKIGHALTEMIEGPSYYKITKNGPDISTSVSHVNDVVEYMVLQAALTNSKTVADSFHHWIEGDGLMYETRVLLSGIQIDDLIQCENGVCLEKLPDRVSALPDRLPRNASIDESDYLGRVVLVVKCRIQPAIWNPNRRPQITPSWALGSHTIRDFAEAMSLVTDTEVNDLIYWRDIGQVEAIQIGSVPTMSRTHYKTRNRDCDIFIQKEDVEKVFDLLNQCIDKKILRIGISQWFNSKRYLLSDVEKLVYLRTALESLLLDDGNKTELRFRLALHGACLIAKNEDDRKTYYRKLKKFYGLASKAVHAGEIDSTTENRDLIEFGQEFCRQVVLKRAKGPKKIDWEDLILGSEN